MKQGPGRSRGPYRGLDRFEVGDGDLFFGRGGVVDEVIGLVRERRFVVLSGPSGSGKSSLLRAGVVPALGEAHLITPGPAPATTHGHLLALAEAPAEAPIDVPERWVVIDQFEEVFTRCTDLRERAAFLDLLHTARTHATGPHLLLAVRADFHPHRADHPALADPWLPLPPMTARELREAMVGPAQHAGLIVERALTARLLEETADAPGALPLLSHALLENWHRRRGRLLTLAAHETAGGVPGALAALAEETYEALPRHRRTPPASSWNAWSSRARAPPTRAARSPAPNSPSGPTRTSPPSPDT
ncbi:hypothetical protein IAG44_03690 [Streptomyces roseirectus]|uniref:Novel STAND NTPase 1 domain-containing protein n=1 Tax=Streptomyces roseirectus TaxID=2768066 RepID=A0A7H0I788_9ACTN|nr:hypothetical protein IAG44_03690 [Streptomyces roseirectus]